MRVRLRCTGSMFLIALGLALGGCGKQSAPVVRLLATTSAQDSGLLDVIRPAFEQRNGYKLEVIAVGSGAALRQGAQGEGDVLLVHDPEAEKKWLAEGHGVARQLVMYNDFVIAGPHDDPAKVKGQTASEALRRIAACTSPFVSRGDKSGTHVRELSLWKKAGVDPKGKSWYIESGQGMGLTLEVASQHQRYVLCDRSTFLVQQRRLSLSVLVEADTDLLNLYHVLTVNAARFPRLNAVGGNTLAEFLLSPPGQDLIGSFGREKFGQSLFTPAAGRTESALLKVSVP